jgi:hypothetical protein
LLTVSSGSGGSNSNTASTTDNSSRFSAVSTTSTDLSAHHQNDKYSDIPLPPVPKDKKNFSLKAAGRTFSFGRNKSTASISEPIEPPNPPIPPKDEGPRSRPATNSTTSSYASTATPPRIDERPLSLGGDFANMFSGFGNKRKSIATELDMSRAMSESPVVSVDFHGARSDLILDQETSPLTTRNPYTVHRKAAPTQSHIAQNGEPPNSFGKDQASERLMSNASPAPVQLRDDPPLVPRHTSPVMQKSTERPNGGLRRNSAIRRQSLLSYGDGEDEDAKIMRESVNAMKKMNDTSYQRVRDSWVNPDFRTESSNASTIKTSQPSGSLSNNSPYLPEPEGDNLFDSHIAASATLAQQFTDRTNTPPVHAPKNKVMTTAQFEKYRNDQERMKSFGLRNKDEDEDDEDTYEDEEDEEEKLKEQARQRRKQEAHMAVYRQTMMKVTGETSMPPRPTTSMTQSTPNLHLYGDDQADDDEDIPLAILAAHGFPNKTRPPSHLTSMGSNPNLRASSQMSLHSQGPRSVAGDAQASGHLPAFARRLPKDPYFGASIVNPSNRESLAMGSGAGSVYGGNSAPRVPPGGLIGVIASEERSRAMRRGSPGPNGEYGSLPPPTGGFNGLGMPAVPGQMQRAMTMGQVPTAGEMAQLEMAQQMQQFMAMQMQFMQMQMMGQGGQIPGGQIPGGPQNPQPGMVRASTMGNMGNMMGFGQPNSRPASSHLGGPGMLDQNFMNGNQRNNMFAPPTINGYAPSIAPSERSNVGMPGRYRPVSHAPLNDQSRTNSMSGALSAFNFNGKVNGNGSALGSSGLAISNGNTKMPSATVRAVQRAADDDDEDEGWAKMKVKKESKMSKWRRKKDPDADALKEMAAFTN